MSDRGTEWRLRLSPEEYLKFERQNATRHVFLDGELLEMESDSLSHSRIYVNLVGEVGSKLKGTSNEPLSMNMKVVSADTSLFAYPDLTVVCGKPLFFDSTTDVLLNPTVIVEVLSPSTETFDRTTKFARFKKGNETLTDYILVSQNRPLVEHFVRQPDDQWPYRTYDDLSDTFEIESIEISLDLKEIYDRVEFEPLNETEH